jgi:C4-dicarboxylate-specific signal transduction histidine kinase
VHDRLRELIIRSKLHAPDDGVLIAVEDSGTGLEAGAGDSIFDSMFTPKPTEWGWACQSHVRSLPPRKPDMGVAR